jgi:hypothetical protein
VYKSTIVVPPNSNGAATAQWVDTDGYHQSTHDQELKTFRWYNQLTVPASHQHIWALINGSTTNDILIHDFRVFPSHNSTGTGVTRFLSLARISARTGGTLQGNPVPMKTGDLWDNAITIYGDLTTTTPTEYMAETNFWEGVVTSFSDATAAIATRSLNLLEYRPHARPQYIRAGESFSLENNIAGQAAGNLSIIVIMSLLNVTP